MARKRNRYDDKFRANAIVMLTAAGYPQQEGALARVASHLGIPSPTLHRWAKEKNNPPPSELVTEKKGELVDWINKELEAVFGDLASKRADATWRDMITGIGILVDKRQLLSGEPTENARTRIIIEYADPETDSA